MSSVKILICGDSFSVSSPGSWTTMLSHDYNVLNVSQAGVSEYKILQQVKNNLCSNPNIVIVSHTSPYRVHTPKHPIHWNNDFYSNCDLLYSDIEYHYNQNPTPELASAMGYFEHHFDPDYYNTIYSLLRDEIAQYVSAPLINVDFFPGNTGLDLSDLPKSHPGQPNHMSESGHKIAYEKIFKEISNLELDKS